MKKDIPFIPVNGVSVAVARKKNLTDYEWYVYIINKNQFPITNILISSKGYGEKEGEVQKTSILRHLIEEMEPQSSAIIEPIDPAVFHLFNEYWVSYYVDGQIYDKKFIFVPDSISDNNLIKISHLELEGVLHE